MKSLSAKAIAVLFILLNFLTAKALCQVSQIVPEGYSKTNNWIQSWKDLMGTESDAKWISEQMNNDAELWVSENGQSLILVQHSENTEGSSAQAMVEEGFEVSNSVRLFLQSSSSISGNSGWEGTFSGEISGKKVALNFAVVQQGCKAFVNLTRIERNLNLIYSERQEFIAFANQYHSAKPCNQMNEALSYQP